MWCEITGATSNVMHDEQVPRDKPKERGGGERKRWTSKQNTQYLSQKYITNKTFKSDVCMSTWLVKLCYQ